MKFALHGFWGDVHQLLELYVEQGNEYIVQHMVKIREAIRQGKQPRVMEHQTCYQHFDWDQEIKPCGLAMKKALKTKSHLEDRQFHQSYSCSLRNVMAS